MAKVLDKATGLPAEIPDAQLHDQWKAGKVEPIAGQKYQIRTADGSYGHVPAESLAAALDAGAQLAAPAEAKAAAQADDAGGALKAGALGFADQGTLGAGRWLAKGALGLEEKVGMLPPGTADKTLREWQDTEESHPIAKMVGEGIGATAGAASTGIGGLVEGLGGRGAAALGLSSTTAGRIAARLSIQAAKAGAESAQFGVAKALSDDAFADHHLTAAQVISEVGATTLWGAGLGAAFGAVGAGAKALAAGREASALAPAAESEVRGALDKAIGGSGAASDADIAAIAGRTLGVEPADGLGPKMRKWYVKMASATSGKDADAIEHFVGGELEPGTPGYENRKALLEADATRDNASRDIRSHIDEMMSASRELEDETRGTLKRGHLRAAVADVEPAKAAETARTLADTALSRLQEMAQAPEDYGGVAPLKRAIQISQKISDKLDAAIASNDVAEQFGLVDDLKRAVGKYTKGAHGLDSRNATDELINLQNRARAAGLAQAYEGLRTGLEDETVWGKAATLQKDVNAAWTQQIDASKRFHQALTTDVGRDPSNPWRNVRGVDPEKADKYVRGLMNPNQDLTHKAVTDYVTGTAKLADVIASTVDLPAEKVAELKSLQAAAKGFQATLDKTTKTLTLVNQFEQMRAVTTGNATGWATAAGTVLGGIGGGAAGMAVGKLAGLFTNPADAVMQMAQIERMARESDGRIARALRGFARSDVRAVARPELDTYARKSAQVARLAADPAGLADRVGKNLGTMRSKAPRLADAMTATTVAGLALLRDKLPPQPMGDPLDPKRAPPVPPAGVREQWLRYYDAVREPTSVVEAMRGGRLSPEGIEVLKTVYPPLFGRVQQIAAEHMASGKMRDLGGQQRIALGLLLDLPIPELAPGYVQARQAAYQQPSDGQGPEGGGPARRGKPVNLAKRAPTLAADRVEGGTAL